MRIVARKRSSLHWLRRWRRTTIVIHTRLEDALATLARYETFCRLIIFRRVLNMLCCNVRMLQKRRRHMNALVRTFVAWLRYHRVAALCTARAAGAVDALLDRHRHVKQHASYYASWLSNPLLSKARMPLRCLHYSAASSSAHLHCVERCRITI